MPMNIPEMVARNARVHPHKVALVDVEPGHNTRAAVTWSELDERVNRVANALRALGVQPGDRVSQIMYNSTRFLEVYLGILRTGAWAAPLSFRFLEEEIVEAVSLSGARTVFVGPEFAARVAAVKDRLGTVRDLLFMGTPPVEGAHSYEELISAAEADPVQCPASGENVASLYYTSGTTGKPKLIMLTHDNLQCAAISNHHNRKVQPNDNFLLLPPLYHAGSIMMWYAHLVVGAPTTILLGLVKPEYVLKTIEQERISILFLVTAWAQDILGFVDQNGSKSYDTSTCRLLSMGAQPIPTDLIRRWRKTFAHMEYMTDYGLGEANGPGCMHLPSGHADKWGSIGRASFNWEARVVGPDGVPLGPGEVGELSVRGDGVMRGYYNDPKQTAEVLRDGWLYTGDMARVDEDGFFWLVDRKKQMIISGGENIFPAEIEEVLHEHPKVYDAAVIGVPDVRLGEVPLAIVDPWTGEHPTPEEILDYCRRKLAKFKCPARVVFDKIPRNPTGKIEKPRLRLKYAGHKETVQV